MPSGAVNAALLADVNTPTFNIATQDAYFQGAFIVDGGGTNVGHADLNNSLRLRAGYSPTVGLGQPFDSLPVNFARAFLEVEFDAGTGPETMTDADWQAARKTALADGIAKAAAMGANLDMPLLMFMEAGAPALTVNDAFTLVPMRTPDSYNAVVDASKPTIDPTGSGGALEAHTVADVWQQILVVGIVRSFARNGYMPGLTVIQAPYGSSWTIVHLADDSSGSSFEYRGGVLYDGKAFYSDTTRVLTAGPPWLGYDTTSNGCHELGHVLLRLHGPGFDAHRAGGGGGASATAHDAINGSICVMSYKSCEGNFCAKCLFAFRGWKGLP